MRSQTQTEPPASPTLKPASSQQVRTKFLSVIGIESPAEHHSATPPKARHMSKEWIHPRQKQAARFEETLKYNQEEDALYSPKRKNEDSNSSDVKKSKKRISFDTTVKVVPIPTRDEYSNRVRSRLWSNAFEIHQNATRNSIEFAAEG